MSNITMRKKKERIIEQMYTLKNKANRIFDMIEAEGYDIQSWGGSFFGLTMDFDEAIAEIEDNMKVSE